MAGEIEIESVGEDVYILRARGHHDVHAFMRQVRADGYTWPLGMPVHTYARTIPTSRAGWNCLYTLCDKPARGAYPVTYAQEAWGDESYEAIAAQQSVAA